MHYPHPRPPAALRPPARFAVPLDENGFVDWLVDAEPGDTIAYYRGHLAHDRMPSTDVLGRRARSELHAVANRVMAASDQGLVIPVQRRLGPEDFLYLAVKAVGGIRRRPASIARSAPPLAREPAPIPAAPSDVLAALAA